MIYQRVTIFAFLLVDISTRYYLRVLIGWFINALQSISTRNYLRVFTGWYINAVLSQSSHCLIYQRVTIYFNAKLSSHFHWLIYQRVTISEFSLVDLSTRYNLFQRETIFAFLLVDISTHYYLRVVIYWFINALQFISTRNFLRVFTGWYINALLSPAFSLVDNYINVLLSNSTLNKKTRLWPYRPAIHATFLLLWPAVTYGLCATSRAEQREQGRATIGKAHTGLDTYSRRIAAGFNRQVRCREVVTFRALDDHSVWSVIVDEVGGWSAMCFTAGFLWVAVCLCDATQLGSIGL